MSSRRRTVTIVQRTLPHYRVPFLNKLRSTLEGDGVGLRVIYGSPNREEELKGDTADLDWGERVNNRRVALGQKELVWQPYVRTLAASDLVIVEQASKLLLNYVLIARRMLGGARVAFWGHGRNLKAHTASPIGEWVKRTTSRRADWWFSYTESSAEILRHAGIPPERITVVQNAIDTSDIAGDMSTLRPEKKDELRHTLGIEGKHVAAFVGGMYEEKRLPFLIDALEVTRREVPDFEFIAIGGGPEESVVADAAARHPWIHHTGPLFGPDKVAALTLADVLVMPGLVGLAVLDSFALGRPMLTIELSYHSPEFSYLQHEVNGVVLGPSTDSSAYGKALANLIQNDDLLRRLREGCARSAAVYTIDNMVSRFSDGVLRAIAMV